jgi:hypothetical protein
VKDINDIKVSFFLSKHSSGWTCYFTQLLNFIRSAM